MNNYFEQTPAHSKPKLTPDTHQDTPAKLALSHLAVLVKNLHSFLMSQPLCQRSHRDMSQQQLNLLQNTKKTYEVNCLLANVLAVDSAVRVYVQRTKLFQFQIAMAFQQFDHKFQHVFKNYNGNLCVVEANQELDGLRQSIQLFVTNQKPVRENLSAKQVEKLSQQNRNLTASLQRLQQKYRHLLSSQSKQKQKQKNSGTSRSEQTEQSYGITRKNSKQPTKYLPTMRISVQLLQRKIRELELQNANLNYKYNQNKFQFGEQLEKQLQVLRTQNRQQQFLIEQLSHRLRQYQSQQVSSSPYFASTRKKVVQSRPRFEAQTVKQSTNQYIRGYDRLKQITGLRTRQNSAPIDLRYY